MEILKKVKRFGNHLTFLYWKDQVLSVEYCLSHLADLKRDKGGSKFSFSCCIFVAKDYKRAKLDFFCDKGSICFTISSEEHEYYDLFKVHQIIKNVETCLKHYCTKVPRSEWTETCLKTLFYEVLKYTGVAINDDIILRLYQLAVCLSLVNDKRAYKSCM